MLKAVFAQVWGGRTPAHYRQNRLSVYTPGHHPYPVQSNGAWQRAGALIRLCCMHVKKLTSSSYMEGSYMVTEPHRAFYLVFRLGQESYAMEKTHLILLLLTHLWGSLQAEGGSKAITSGVTETRAWKPRLRRDKKHPFTHRYQGTAVLHGRELRARSSIDHLQF